MLEIIKKFDNIISSFNILLYEREDINYRFNIEIVFVDSSKLFVRDYLFGEVDRKYVYHWMDQDSNLLIRWDNAEHWPSIPTFPHHKHIINEKNVKESTEISLEEVLKAIEISVIPKGQ